VSHVILESTCLAARQQYVHVLFAVRVLMPQVHSWNRWLCENAMHYAVEPNMLSHGLHCYFALCHAAICQSGRLFITLTPVQPD
jgi:hypothetical protein